MGKKTGKRYVKEILLNLEQEFVESRMEEYLKRNDFKLVTEKGVTYYKTKGVYRGFLYWYVDGILHIEAWLGKIGKEMDISDGKFAAALYKVPYYNSVLSLLGSFENVRQMEESVDPLHQERMNENVSASNENHAITDEIRKANNRNAVLALLLSIASLILVASSRVSWITTAGSYYLADRGMKSNKRAISVAAIVLNTIALIIAIVILISSFFA